MLLILVFFLLFSALLVWSGVTVVSRAAGCPPGPLPLPVIGHLHLFVHRPPLHKLFTQLFRRYGPIVSLHIGSISLVVASTRDSATAFLKTHDAVFASRPPTTLGRVLFYNSQTMGRAPYGNRLRQLRKLCIMELFSPRRMDSFRKHRLDEVKSLLQQIVSSAKPSEPSSDVVACVVDVRTSLYHALFNIVSQMLISKRYFGEGGDSREAAEFIHVMNDISLVVGEIFSIGEFFPWLKWLDLDGFESRVKAVAAGVDRFLGRIVDERVLTRQGGDDFLDLLLRFRDEGEEYLQGDTIKALLLDLFTGGIDTSTMTLEWALAEMISNPKCMAKAQEEMDTVVGPHRLVEESDIANLPYLQACVKETFRLHPPAPLMVPHYSLEDCKVMGYNARRGTMLVVNVYAIGRDPQVWPEPLTFQPERFLGSQVDVRGKDFELLPFGSGRRACPGIPLAVTVVQLLLANLVHGFNWTMPPGKQVDMTEKYGLLVILDNKLEAVPTLRLDHKVYT